MDYNKFLIDVLEKNKIIANENMLSQFEQYYKLLVEYNNKINLTSITEKEEVYVKHFADSLLGANEYRFGATICDIGTGAGFPGLALKIARPDLNVVLVDSLNKRITFLQKVIEALQLTNITTIHSRAEDKDFKNKYINSFDYVCARAVAVLPTLTEYCLPFVKIGGLFVAYKSINVDKEIQNAKLCINLLGGRINSIKVFKLDDNTDRTVIYIEKMRETDIKYPRDKNKPRLDPIL